MTNSLLLFLKERKTIKMAKHILKCAGCNTYTLLEECPVCKSKAVLPKPPKFSLIDKYARFRRETKKEDLKKKGLY